MIKETKMSIKELEKRLDHGLILADTAMAQVSHNDSVEFLNGSLSYYTDNYGEEYYSLDEIPDEILDSEEYAEIPETIFHYYILSPSDAEYIIDNTNLIVLYAPKYDLYFYGRTTVGNGLEDTYFTFYEYIDEE